MGCFQSVLHLTLRDGMPAKEGVVSVVVKVSFQIRPERGRGRGKRERWGSGDGPGGQEGGPVSVQVRALGMPRLK